MRTCPDCQRLTGGACWRHQYPITVGVAASPAVLLRDTPEDRERLARRMHDHFHDPFGHHEFGAGCADGEVDADGWRREADAIIAALREPRRYPESGG